MIGLVSSADQLIIIWDQPWKMRMTVREWMTQRRKGKTKEKTRFSVFHSFGFSFLMFSKVRSCMFITYKTEDDGINLWLLTVISFFFLTACLFSFILSSVILCRHSSSGPVINLRFSAVGHLLSSTSSKESSRL